MSPYIFPDGPVQIAFSGGRTSAYMLHEILEANGGLQDRAVVVFTNTGREMPQTLDFIQECSVRWHVPITWLEYRPGKERYEVVSHNSAARDGEPFEALIRKRKGLPYKFARFCTAALKVTPAKHYLMREHGFDRWVCAIGIRADERHRALGQPRERWIHWRPLLDAGVTKRDVQAFWARQPFNLRLPIVKGTTPLGNCDGCFLKSEANRAALAREYPERAEWWARMEAMCVENGWAGKNPVFIDGKPYRELIDFVARQGDWIFDMNEDGAFCQADDGECFG